ncbi:acyl-CoA dehydrogenase family protein [Streptomyces sp. NPDC006335]|uniref:acyl-CoA dehydrogenase family protein n=1 Tax=Streptomyces sp. NPDC006335 TaxID=3156895 RepID=UPI0033B1B8BB
MADSDILSGLVELIRRNAAEADRTGTFPVENLTALKNSGLMGLLVPKEQGGREASLAEFTDIAQQLAGACLSTAMIWAMHCQQVDILRRHAHRELAARLLPRIAAGEVYLASVTTENGKGGLLTAAQDPLRTDGTRSLSFERDAPVVTGGRHADGFLITLRARPDANAREVSLVYADRSELKAEETGDWEALGMRATESIGLRLSGQVPRTNLIGDPGQFTEVAVDSMIPLAHLGWSACWLGAARGVFAQLVSWLREPTRRGGPDLHSDLVKERLARVRFDLELVHAYLQRATEEVTAVRASGQSVTATPVQLHLNTLKLAASELCFAAVDRMVQLAGLSGGYSSRAPLPLERVFRDLRSAALNYANDRLWTVNGGLLMLDRDVTLL